MARRLLSLLLTSWVCISGAVRQHVDVSAGEVHNRTSSGGPKELETAAELEQKVDLVTCPVLAGLYRRGHLHPDEHGRVSSSDLVHGLKKTGASFQVSTFQAVGISGFASGDIHQSDRRVGPMSFVASRYLNIFTMQPADDCSAVGGEKTEAGFPCNANTQFQQHGYSTTLRDSRFDKDDPGRLRRFDFWIGRELVARPDLEPKEPVMLMDGFVRMLARARGGKLEGLDAAGGMLAGDFSGEYSLTREGEWEGSNLQKYHPSVTEPSKYQALSQWQPLFAWCGWWRAFSRRAHGVDYFTKGDLEAFFLRGDFPADWEARAWGFRGDFDVMSGLEGQEVGDEWISIVKWMNSRTGLGAFADEAKFNTAMLMELVADLGIQRDSVQNAFPPEQP